MRLALLGQGCNAVDEFKLSTFPHDRDCFHHIVFTIGFCFAGIPSPINIRAKQT